MAQQSWKIRNPNVYIDPRLKVEIYEKYPTLFTIELHHGGYFTKFPGIKYKDGDVRYIDFVDIDMFSVHQLDKMIEKIGYPVPLVIYYQFRIPGAEFHLGLRALVNDEDVQNLAKYLPEHRILQVYTEEGKTNLMPLFMLPTGKPIVEEIVEVNEHNIKENVDEQQLTDSPEMRRSSWSQSSVGISCCNKRLCFDDFEHGDANVDIDLSDFDGYQASIEDDDDEDSENDMHFMVEGVEPIKGRGAGAGTSGASGGAADVVVEVGEDAVEVVVEWAEVVRHLVVEVVGEVLVELVGEEEVEVMVEWAEVGTELVVEVVGEVVVEVVGEVEVIIERL